MKRRVLRIGISVALLVTAALIVDGCSDDDSITGGDTSNHTFVLANGGSNTIECTARQFARVELRSTQDPGVTVSKTFVSNPNTTIDIELTLPETGNYRVTFYVADIDSSIWWDSIALATGASTSVALSTNNSGFHDNSYVAGIRSSGDNIPCD